MHRRRTWPRAVVGWVFFPIGLGVFTTASCVMNKIEDVPVTIELPSQHTGAPVVISLVRGAEYTHVMGAGPVKFNVLPQTAVWIEANDGTFVETLYVSGAHYREMKHAAKQEGASFWKECFPVWSSKVVGAGQALPSKEKPFVDGMTSATPQSSATLRTRLPASTEAFVVFAEVNKSGDYNATFTEENSGWVGQPSVIYRAQVPRPAGEHQLEPIGHAGARGAHSGSIVRELGQLDTALKIFDAVKISFPSGS